MRFNVPKYIDIEDKIFGPLTFKQFVYLIGGAGLCVIALWLSPNLLIAIPIILLVVVFSLALAFFDYNGKPFIYTVRAAFMYATRARTYIWKRRDHEDKSEQQLQKELEQIESIMEEKDSDTIGKKSVDVAVGAENKQKETTPDN